MANEFTVASGSTYDLQDTTYNPGAAPIATPRVEGFTLRNRIKWSNAKSSTNILGDGSQNANTLRILTVPSRTLIRALSFGVVPGSSATVNTFTSGSTSAGSGAKLEVGAQGHKDASQTAASIVTSRAAFKTSITMTASTGATSTFGTVSASTPWTQAVNIGTSSKFKAVAYPFGGFVVMNIKNSTGANANNMSSSVLTGVLEVRATCEFMPE